MQKEIGMRNKILRSIKMLRQQRRMFCKRLSNIERSWSDKNHTCSTMECERNWSTCVAQFPWSTRVSSKIVLNNLSMTHINHQSHQKTLIIFRWLFGLWILIRIMLQFATLHRRRTCTLKWACMWTTTGKSIFPICTIGSQLRAICWD